MKNVIKVNPFDCRMWKLHDRLDSHVNETTCRAEIESISKHGQLVPALGRPLHGDPKHKIELIYGARRLFVTRHLNKQLLVEVRDLSDREAIVAMDIENRHRKDLSPYERGLSYATWLREGHFRSQDDIARALRVSASQISRMLKIAQLPPVVINLFNSPAELLESWALKLAVALVNPVRKQATLRQAHAISEMEPRPAASEVFRRLLAASASGRKVVERAHDEVVKDSVGVPLFRIRQMPQSISVVIPTEKVSQESLANIRSAIAEILQSTCTEAPNSDRPSHPHKETRCRTLSQSPLMSVARLPVTPTTS